MLFAQSQCTMWIAKLVSDQGVIDYTGEELHSTEYFT